MLSDRAPEMSLKRPRGVLYATFVDSMAVRTTCCFSWFFVGRSRRAGGLSSGERGATKSRSDGVARARRLLDGVTLAKAGAEQVLDLLPHLDIVVVVVA